MAITILNRRKRNMSINVDIEKLNYKEFVDKLMKNPKINNKDLLEKIILEFGNKVGKELVILHNEFWEDGICDWNMFAMIQEIFELEDDEYVSDVYYELRKGLINYKEIDEAYENLGLERSNT
jgi:hypothetical protein